MLRILFGESRRGEAGKIGEISRRISAFLRRRSRKAHSREHREREYRLDLWAQGFVSALDELEQSVYASTRYFEQLEREWTPGHDLAKLEGYDRYNYFYKNALIRVFSILDKLGYFLDAYYRLDTAGVKEKFSYFTVLRQMRRTAAPAELLDKLAVLKEGGADPLQRLRNRRNMEIHYMNAEMLDEFFRECRTCGEQTTLEDVKGKLADLIEGYEMTCASLDAVFAELTKRNPQ